MAQTHDVARSRHMWKTDLTLAVRSEDTPAVSSWVDDLLDTEIAALELLASRFRPDSQVSAVNRNAGHWVEVSWDFVAVLTAALDAAAAWWLARRTVAPLRDLEHTANAVAAGDLDARAPASTITEIDHVGVALNRVTERVQELLKEEREYTAELAHQLRTPLTALSVDVDAVPDPDVRQQLQDDVTAVNRMVDEIITTARRSSREGLRAGCDAAEVVRARALFWNVLAEDQRRTFTQEIPNRELPVRLMADDLSSALDILFQNVFLHTPEGSDFGIRVTPDDGFVDVTVWDRGAGFDISRERGAVGSTQLGLSIAARLIGCQKHGSFHNIT